MLCLLMECVLHTVKNSQASMFLGLTGYTSLDSGLVYTIDTQPGKQPPNRDCPECMTSQWTGVKAIETNTFHYNYLGYFQIQTH